MLTTGQDSNGVTRPVLVDQHRRLITGQGVSRSQFHRATGAAAIASTLAPGVPWRLESIRLHLSAVGAAANLTATIDHGTSAVYDTVLLTQDMTTVTDLFWQAGGPEFSALDELDIAWVNGSTRTYGLEIEWREVY